MLGQLVTNSWKLTQDFNEAELILINTCGFIESAKQESIEQILEMVKYKETGKCKKLVVAGCLVVRYGTELAAELPEVDYWLGFNDIRRISELVATDPSPLNRGETTKEKAFLNEENLPRFQATLKHTAYVKIAEGCNHRCAYCAIPLIKGSFQSRSKKSIINEINSLVEAGVQEVNLIAQDITMYGQDLTPQSSLLDLLKEIVSQTQIPWIRLLYAYPAGINDQLLEFMAQESRICNYLDLPLQHINERLLKMMNRTDDPLTLKKRLQRIRELVSPIILRTTFMAGFPSESRAEFEEVLTFLNEFHFNYVGAFAYSEEEGTKAFALKPQINQKIRQRRQQRILKEQQPISARLLQGEVGHQKLVLVDKVVAAKNLTIGRTQGMAPDVDGVVVINDYLGQPGEFVNCLITGSDAYNLYGSLS